MDGIKTGYIHASGFNLVASAVQNNRRIVGVVFGGRSSSTRNSHMSKILDEGFVLARNLPPTRLAAARLPKPAKKPDVMQVVYASLDGTALAAGRDNANYSNDNNSTRIDEMLGQGDIDPSAAQRLETGLMAIAAHTGLQKGINGVGKFGDTQQKVAKKSDWAIQIGAYSSRDFAGQAIQVASKSLPPELRPDIKATALPLTTGSRTIYRARMEGFNEATAKKACAYIRNCMIIAP
jgi:D-alanyl-D-alanine carboxypeptidase